MNIQFSNRTLDRFAYQSQNLDFADIIDREGKKWLVYEPDPNDKAASPWSLAEVGDHVRVPLVPHLTVDCDPSKALGYAWQLGFQMAMDLLGSGTKISAMHLSIGSPLEQLHDQQTQYPLHFKFWMGFAFKVDS